MKIWRNGLFLSESEAVISVYDESSMFGSGVFEMTRTFNKKVFKLREHMERLLASCRYVEIDIPYTVDHLVLAHDDLMMRNRFDFPKGEEVRSLINVSRGTLPMYEGMAPLGSWVMMTTFPLRIVLNGAYAKYINGISAVVTSQRNISAQFLDPKVKSRSRLHYKMADLEAERIEPGAWPLMLDSDGFVTESSGANFFVVKNKWIPTPLPHNILNGISRKYVSTLGIGCIHETDITIYDIYDADEAFFTCTPYSILPCVKINGRKIGNGKPGSVTKMLMKKWSESVNCDFVEQTRDW